MATRQEVLKKLETLYRLGMRGDADAIAVIEAIKTQAKKGDPRSKMALGVLALVHQGQTAEAERWAQATSLYLATKDGDPRVKPVLASIVKKAKNGKADAVDFLARMRAVHQGGGEAPVAAGAPRLGGYGPPTFHTAGVRFHKPRLIVGASQEQLVRLYELMQRALESRPVFQNFIQSSASNSLTAQASTAPKPRSFAEAMAEQAEDRTAAMWSSMLQRSALESSSVSSALAGF